MKINNTIKLIISLIIPQLAGGLASFFTIASVKDWYPLLVKPVLNPPAWIFGPVWTTLFLLMGIAAFLVWKKGLDRRDVKIALGIFLGQLVFTRFGRLSFSVCTAQAVRLLKSSSSGLLFSPRSWLLQKFPGQPHGSSCSIFSGSALQDI